MAFPQEGRQYPLVAKVGFTYTDLGAAVTAGTVLEALDLPINAIIVGGYLAVTTAWATSATATVDVGDAVDPNRYSASPIDLMSTGRTALTLTGYKYTAADTLDLTLVITTDAATAGEAVLVVKYILDGRANDVQT